jgi:cell division FtsZ-interacting protein ZapD
MKKNSANYEHILEENLRNELLWLEEEFDILFKSKKDELTQEDIQLGNQILNNVIDNLNLINNEDLLTSLALSLERIENSYPDFF